MSDIKLPEMWIIRNKETREVWKAPSGKTSWKAKGHAKNAWASLVESYHQDIVLKRCKEYGLEKVFNRTYEEVNYYRFPYFDEQDKYELVELHYDITVKLGRAELILKDILDNFECGDKVDNMIKEYFKIE